MNRNAKPKRSRPLSKCCGKTAYESKGHALGAAVSASRKTGKAIRVYRGRCGKYHHTTQTHRKASISDAA